MCDQDPDVVRWGLDFLDVDQIFSSSYYGDTNNADVDISPEQYLRESHHDAEFNNVENDEIIAHTLQEELSQLSVAEGTESSNAVEEHFQASTTSNQDWYYPSTRNHYYGALLFWYLDWLRILEGAGLSSHLILFFEIMSI